MFPTSFLFLDVHAWATAAGLFAIAVMVICILRARRD